MNISVFASGTGTNFEAILRSRQAGIIESDVKLLITNNSGCGAVKIAENYGVNIEHISRKKYPELSETEFGKKFLKILKNYGIEFIALAGYMKMIPVEVTEYYNERIINIHPALLPSFGGKGMFGINVHKAVIEAGVKVTGITIHFVNKEYDKGKIIFQKCIEIDERDDEFTLQKKVLKLEHEYYSLIISKLEKEVKR